jgi:hypothetical protein
MRTGPQFRTVDEQMARDESAWAWMKKTYTSFEWILIGAMTGALVAAVVIALASRWQL